MFNFNFNFNFVRSVLAVDNQADTMRLLTKVISESAKKQDEMLQKLSKLNELAAQGKHSTQLHAKVAGLHEQVEKLGTIKKLADITDGLGPGASGQHEHDTPVVDPATLTFTPPSLQELKAKAENKKEDL